MNKSITAMIGMNISHYKILEELGRGGMGVVYKAEDTKLKRIVALKFLPPELTRDPELKKRFIHEAQAASALEHPNICTVFEIGETEDGTSFIVLSYCKGETLKKKIARGPLNIDDAIKIALQIASGLALAHESNVIHRDIKPANIMIMDTGEAKIVDFGLAKLLGQTKLTTLGSTVGTVAYMSPEQTKGEQVDIRSDIWSLGVVFYEMICGQLPFKGDYDQAVIYSILNEEPRELSELCKDIPDQLKKIITNALVKDPSHRYKNLSEFIHDLSFFSKEKQTRKKIRIFPRLKRTVLVVSTFILTSVILLILFYPTKTIPFSERDWVVITDFENLTGEDVFDKSLYTAFILSIDQSRHVNVFSRRRMLETLTRMKLSSQEYISEETGREIAIREGINLYIVPSISKVGNKYILTGKIQDAQTSDILKSEILYAEEQDDILSQLDNLGNKIRKDLGESLYAISQQSKPLSQVTTSSLEALKQYSIGIEHHWNSEFEKARIFYENALRIDSGFISAKASLGNLQFERFDRELGRKYLSEAIKSVNSLSEKEKYGILAFHAVNVENDLEHGIEFTKTRIELYPDDPTPRNNLGWYYQQAGRYSDAVDSYKAALKINPYLVLTYGGLIWCYLDELGQIDSAKVWTRKLLSIDKESQWAYFYLGSVYVGEDSLLKAEQAFKIAYDLNPNFTMNSYRLAHVYRLQKKYDQAITVLKHIIKMDSSEVSAFYNLGLVYQLFGNHSESVRQYTRYLDETRKWIKQYPQDAASLTSFAAALTRIGQKKAGWVAGTKAMQKDSTLHIRIAEFLCTQNKIEEALNHLKNAVSKGYKNVVWLKLNPDFHVLADEPEFQALCASIRGKSVN